jgi:hypothetical protein
MSYDSSESGNIDCTGRTNDKYDQRSPSRGVAQAVHKTPETARNWAWVHSTESYDWMDSHSPFNTQDLVH